METIETSDSCKVVRMGSGIGVQIKKNPKEILGVKLGDLLEVRFRTTGKNLPKREVKKRDEGYE